MNLLFKKTVLKRKKHKELMKRLECRVRDAAPQIRCQSKTVWSFLESFRKMDIITGREETLMRKKGRYSGRARTGMGCIMEIKQRLEKKANPTLIAAAQGQQKL